MRSFIVSSNNQPLASGGNVLFTRAGSFTVDAKGYMVNAQGLFLQGWPVGSNGTVVSSPTSLSAIEPVFGREQRVHRSFGWCARDGHVVPVGGAAPDVLLRRLAVRPDA